MKVRAPKESLNKTIILPEIGEILIPEDGIIEVSETLGSNLILNLEWGNVYEDETVEPAKDDKIEEDLKTDEDSKIDENIDKEPKVDINLTDKTENDNQEGDVKIDQESLSKLNTKQLIEIAIAGGISEESITVAAGPLKNGKKKIIELILKNV